MHLPNLGESVCHARAVICRLEGIRCLFCQIPESGTQRVAVALLRAVVCNVYGICDASERSAAKPVVIPTAPARYRFPSVISVAGCFSACFIRVTAGFDCEESEYTVDFDVIECTATGFDFDETELAAAILAKATRIKKSRRGKSIERISRCISDEFLGI